MSDITGLKNSKTRFVPANHRVYRTGADCMHIARLAADGRVQLTPDHLQETASYASMLGSKFGLPMTAGLAASLHDMGKLSTAFVQYLRDSASKDPKRLGSSIIHSTQGAKYIYDAAVGQRDLLLAAETVSMCITAHHGGLMDGISPQGDTPLRDRITQDKQALYYSEVIGAFESAGVLTKPLQDLLSACRDELLAFVEKCKTNKLNTAFMVHMLVKSVYSCLVDSDRHNAYCFDIGQVPEARISTPPWDEYAGRLEQYISSFSVVSNIDRIRRDISLECLKASSRQRGIYRLHVPTGGGKTLSSLRFAVNHAKEHAMERIIYVMPYLSVLEQTANEIRKAFQYRDNEEFILEHHSNLAPPDDDEEARSYRLFTDRWNQPIVITTMVQFLESVFSHRGSKLRKLHNMADAILIFDEVQSLPIKCVHLFNEALNYLQTFGKSTILLCTATQPLIDKVPKPIKLTSPSELIADTSEVFEKLKRTRVLNSTVTGGYTINGLRDFVLEKVEAAGNCLVILNTKADAAKLYASVGEHLTLTGAKVRVVHLSTSMCPAHRMDELQAMQETVDNRKVLRDEPILCISTQLIEAGVDISFACVVRALAGLDSIMQAAGRCNRHGEDPNGREVFVVNLQEENLTKLPDIQCGRDVSYRILSESDDLQSRAVMDRYYEEYFYKRQGDMDYPCEHGNMYDLLSCNNKGGGAYKNFGAQAPPPALRQAFQTAGEGFCVIEPNTTSVLVPYGRGVELIKELSKANLKDKPRLLREVGRYSVSLYRYQLRRLEEMRALYYVDEILVLEEDFYDNRLGVVFKTDPAFLLI